MERFASRWQYPHRFCTCLFLQKQRLLWESGVWSSALSCSLSFCQTHTQTYSWTFHPLLLVFLHSARNIVYRLQLNLRMYNAHTYTPSAHTHTHITEPIMIRFYSLHQLLSICFACVCLCVCALCSCWVFVMHLYVCMCSSEAYAQAVQEIVHSDPPTLNLTLTHKHTHSEGLTIWTGYFFSNFKLRY